MNGFGGKGQPYFDDLKYGYDTGGSTCLVN